MAREIIARATDVTRRYRLGAEEVWALNGVSMDIYEGEYLSIMGPSGSGKSTFFNMIGALDVPTSGTIEFMGADLFSLPEDKQAWIRCNQIGYIFQTFNLIMVMSALENVTLPMILRDEPQEQADARGKEILEMVGLGHRVHHLPDQLSGGQRQRVAIARSLANSPRVILADEPTGNLDSKIGQEIIDLLKKLQVEQGVTIITATHDSKMLEISDRIAWIRDGKLERIENREDVEIKSGSMH
ncbi:MAG: ABC transporter ATP-binding protein [Kiritimatiellia bacterium]|jgi:putative ABC transport system ATP-binding protein|nr:ABC transporter ATP-binding protein [Kiritimatiellia bacterium]MDP6810905.1 ABC transporter ATP-binding protein [Kiritimatiellia bacterium]MDP7023377.1 ABC transporter ATP-binding protein [Kiritimatiellia bacterium]